MGGDQLLVPVPETVRKARRRRTNAHNKEAPGRFVGEIPRLPRGKSPGGKVQDERISVGAALLCMTVPVSPNLLSRFVFFSVKESRRHLFEGGLWKEWGQRDGDERECPPFFPIHLNRREAG